MCEYLSSLKIGREKPILSGHNLKFDIGFLVEFFDFHKKEFLMNQNKTKKKIEKAERIPTR